MPSRGPLLGPPRSAPHISKDLGTILPPGGSSDATQRLGLMLPRAGVIRSTPATRRGGLRSPEEGQAQVRVLPPFPLICF